LSLSGASFCGTCFMQTRIFKTGLLTGGYEGKNQTRKYK
jgi:hypothetical protein